MTEIKRERKWTAAGVLVVALSAFVLAGCFAKPGNHMNWQPVEITRTLASDAGNQKWNAYRFETVGPYPEQRIAYVLFNDDLTVDMWKAPYVNLGKMSLRQVVDNHNAYLKEQMWIGTPITFQEYRRGDKVIGYTANEFYMTVDLWEMAAAGPKVDVRVIYIDRRTFSDTGGGGSDGSPH